MSELSVLEKAIENSQKEVKELIEEQRQVSTLAADSEDQGSADLVDAYVQEQEKLVWMYNAFLG